MAGVPVRRTTGGAFQAGDGLGRVAFWGAEFADPQPPQTVERSGAAMVQAALDQGVAGAAAFAPSSDQLRQYDPGRLGGQLWCQTYEYTVLKEGTLYACGWVDQWTVGAIL